MTPNYQADGKRIAYADPPYVGQAKKHYGTAEVNHTLLIAYLQTFDGWALSCSSSSLVCLLPLCPEARVGAWVKPFCSFKPNVNPAYAWEPVLYQPARRRGRNVATVRDWVSTPITLQKGLVGVKPPKFCYWLFDLLGVEPGDSFEDVFPGSGAVTKAYDKYIGLAVLRSGQTQPVLVEL